MVKDSCGKATELSVVGLLVTPRVFGARVSLTPEQLLLWPAGADKVGIPPADLPGVEALPVGSRAHVTLGCAANVLAVQTGIDLLEILILQQGEEKEVLEEELELGKLSYLGEGHWYLSLKECITCNAKFSSFSEEQRPAEPAKKEGGEKKKKLKCSILWDEMMDHGFLGLRLVLCMCECFSALGLGVGNWYVLHHLIIPKQPLLAGAFFFFFFFLLGSTSAKALKSALQLRIPIL